MTGNVNLWNITHYEIMESHDLKGRTSNLRGEPYMYDGKLCIIRNESMRRTGSGSHHYEWDKWVTLEFQDGTHVDINLG